MRLAVGVLVVLGAAVLVPAAFAHDSGLSVAATCNTSTGNYDVTWTVGYTDFRNLSPKIAASNRAAIPVGTALVVPNTPFTESVAGTTTSISATITVTWSDGVTKTYTKALNLAGNCVQDTGSLKLTKSLSGGPQGYTGPFTIGYACDLAHTGTVSVPAGSSATISGIPLGTVCTVNESVPTPPSGYSFGPVTFTDNAGTANDGIVTITTKGATVEVTVNNLLSRDQGYLRIVKVFDANSSGFTGAFSIRYQCGAAAAQTVALAAGASAIAGPFDTGTVCTVSEPSLPSAPSGWTFGSPSISGSPATIVKGTAATPVTVTVTNTITQNSTPPPPPPPSPKTDITVTKTATPAVTLPLGGGTAPITYQMVVSNNGPDPAANVKVSDAAPVSVTFVSATTSAGSCTTTALALDCSVGTLAVGGSATITVNATVNSTGTKVNVVTVTTTTPETNPNNNQAQAQTIVTAPAVPPTPTPKPKPKPAPVICTTVVALQKTLKANGKTQTVKLKVTQGTKGVVARIKLTGPGFSKTVRTGKNGLVTVSLKPSKAGIVKVQIVGTKACNTQRLGVVGVFEPPLTG